MELNSWLREVGGEMGIIKYILGKYICIFGINVISRFLPTVVIARAGH